MEGVTTEVARAEGGGGGDTPVQSPNPRRQRREISLEDLYDHVTANFGQFGSHFAALQEGIQHVSARQDRVEEKVTDLTKRMEALEQRRTTEPAEGACGASSGTSSTRSSELMGVIGGFRYDTRKRHIEDYLREHLPQLLEKGAFAPGARTSIALCPFRDAQDLRSWRDRVSRCTVDGRALWLAPSRPPHERIQRRHMSSMLKTAKLIGEENGLDVDVNYSRGVVWIGEHRIIEKKDDGTWELHEEGIRTTVRDPDKALQRLRDCL